MPCGIPSTRHHWVAMKSKATHLLAIGLVALGVVGAGGAAPPYAPLLVSPNDEVTVYGLNPSPTFKWQPVQEATAYRLCVAELGPQPFQAQQACGGPGTQVYEDITATSFAPPGGLPKHLQGKTFGWQVAACNNLGCTYQAAPHRMTWSAIPQAPVLDLPNVGETLYAFPKLVVVKPGAGAAFYKLCITRPGVACGAEDSVVVEYIESGSPSGNFYYDLQVDQVRRFAGQTVTWTAAACNALGCTWQQAARRITIVPLPAAPALLEPNDGNAASLPTEEFKWSSVPWATYYTFCLSQPGVACGTADPVVREDIRAKRSAEISYTLDLSRAKAFAGQTVTWTAAACNALGCTWQQAARRITIPEVPQ
ncbi:MAG: hypothetical protein KGL31_05690 [candidate division NC10 bacterium]|nr:hypothetical protein [candidate division NC10 bacterium]MDE2321396.1 hypothetical protein [candidate division NC10 bacterium]